MDQEFFNLTAYRHYQRYPTSQMEELRQMYAVWSAWAGKMLPSSALHPGWRCWSTRSLVSHELPLTCRLES